MSLLFLILSTIILVISIVWSIRRESSVKARKILETFSGRESLTPAAFYQRYFMKLGIAEEIVIGVREILEKQFDVDMSRLQAEDDFSKNLSFFYDFDSMADVELVLAIEAHFHIKISDVEAEKTHTVYELIQLISNKVEYSDGL